MLKFDCFLSLPYTCSILSVELYFKFRVPGYSGFVSVVICRPRRVIPESRGLYFSDRVILGTVSVCKVVFKTADYDPLMGA